MNGKIFFFRRIIFFLLIIFLCTVSNDAVANVEETPDSFEPDNEISSAKIIIVDDITPQWHTFHNETDEDWVKFYGLKDTVYRIRGIGVSWECDIAIGIYNKRGDLIKEVNAGSLGENEDLEWQGCPIDNVYYIRIRIVQILEFGEEAPGYYLKLSTMNTPSAQIIGAVTIDEPIYLTSSNLCIKTNGEGSAIKSYNGNVLSTDYKIYHQKGDWEIYAYSPGYKYFFGNISLIYGDTKEYNISLALVDLTDVIKILQMLAGKSGADHVDFRNDMNGDDRLGLEEVIFNMRVISGFYEPLL